MNRNPQNLLQSCDIDVTAKCGVDNEQLKSSNARKFSSARYKLKLRSPKNWQMIDSYKKYIQNVITGISV